MPRESEYVKWRDQVVVPCGQPVDSGVRASELMYNEYIVYNTAQVSDCALTLFTIFKIYIGICMLIKPNLGKLR